MSKRLKQNEHKYLKRRGFKCDPRCPPHLAAYFANMAVIVKRGKQWEAVKAGDAMSRTVVGPLFDTVCGAITYCKVEGWV